MSGRSRGRGRERISNILHAQCGACQGAQNGALGGARLMTLRSRPSDHNLSLNQESDA